jgi:hypothetical protein
MKPSRTAIKDYEGNVIAWEYDPIDTGEFDVTLIDLTKDEKQALYIATLAGTKMGIQKPLEMLAQIKPIGKSDAKQETVISYLVYDLHKDGISEYVVHELCAKYRRMSEQVFFPNYGDFLDAARRKMKMYKTAYERAVNNA